MDVRPHLDANRVIIPSAWALQLRDPTGRVLAAVALPNDILTPGRRDAMRMLTGLASLGIYEWVELGESSTPTNPQTMKGCQRPLLLPGTNTPYRAQGVWTPSGADATFTFSIPGTEITGSVREAALYPSRVGGEALYRIVLPSVLTLGSLNTLTGAVALQS
jgi:hypothetical protein